MRQKSHVEHIVRDALNSGRSQTARPGPMDMARIAMPNASAALAISFVISMSSRDGLGSPEG